VVRIHVKNRLAAATLAIRQRLAVTLGIGNELIYLCCRSPVALASGVIIGQGLDVV